MTQPHEWEGTTISNRLSLGYDDRMDHLFNVNYFCRYASIILAGSPPYPGPAAGPFRSGSWGH